MERLKALLSVLHRAPAKGSQTVPKNELLSGELYEVQQRVASLEWKTNTSFTKQ